MTDLDPDEFRRRGHAVVDWVAAYREGLPDRPVRPDVAPGWVRTALPTTLPEQPEPLDLLLDALDRVVIPASTHWQHPGFFGYFPANASLHSLLGDLLSGGLGAQGMLWATSPAATEVEQTLLDALADALGLTPEFTFASGGGGVIQDSASSAVLVALLAALQRADPAWRENGVDGRERVYVTAETHSSVAKAVRVAGLGSRGLRTVPFGMGTLAMDPSALSIMLAADRRAGLRPVLVCPTIGTTGTGSVDPVGDIAAAATGLWVHVDAAWAGVAALLPEHRGLLDGVDRADSFCTNPHKWLATAFDASLLWVRDREALPAALSVTPEYLRNAASDTGTVVDYRDWQVPLGRRFRALKLWTVLSGYGLDGLRAHVREHIALAAELASWVRDEPGFTLVAHRLGLVCLRLGDDDQTRRVLEQVNATGQVLLTHTTVADRLVIRVAIGGVRTTRENVIRLWELLRKAAANAQP
jgi:aromatic-L-amino-acid/L-tryptophan decarboxylase